MMRDQEVRFQSNGIDANGYLARLEQDDPGPGLVVIQEWWGLNEHIRDVTRRFAEQGFVALAPDLYHGKVVAEPDDAQKAAMELDRGHALQEIMGAVAYLKAQPYVAPKKIGVVGFCMGGGLALHTAARDPNVGAVVAFYGGGSPEASVFAGSQAAVLNIVGERDVRVLTTIQALDAGLKQYPIPHELVVYPGAEHAFFNDTRQQVHKPDAAQDAWKRTLDWFHQYLAA